MNNFKKLGQFKSTGRFFNEKNSSYRTPFQRDRDRIIHSASFRRLKHKTQVFVNTEGDHFRTRITHSIEVSQIARSISKYLKLNDDLAETLSLAHDLGHTPFGHAGENSLKDCMINHGGFDHNLQTLRIVMFLENKYLKFKGLNLTFETLDGLLKHNGPILNVSRVNNIIGIKNLKNKFNFNQYSSLESQISNISDDIAYNNHDIQDGLNANLFKLEEILEINFFKENNSKIINFSENFQQIDSEIKKFLRFKMYNNKKVLSKNTKGQKIIKYLFAYICKNPKKFIKNQKINKDKFRSVSDFISGMTDRYAINLYNNLK
jgi:dGTPase